MLAAYGAADELQLPQRAHSGRRSEDGRIPIGFPILYVAIPKLMRLAAKTLRYRQTAQAGQAGDLAEVDMLHRIQGQLFERRRQTLQLSAAAQLEAPEPVQPPQGEGGGLEPQLPEIAEARDVGLRVIVAGQIQLRETLERV